MERNIWLDGMMGVIVGDALGCPVQFMKRSEIAGGQRDLSQGWNPVAYVYFKKLSSLEYLSYQLMWRYEGIRKEFEKIKKKHLNSPLVEGRLYAPDLSKEEFGGRLSEIVLPVYQSAKAAGFREWEYTI